MDPNEQDVEVVDVVEVKEAEETPESMAAEAVSVFPSLMGVRQAIIDLVTIDSLYVQVDPNRENVEGAIIDVDLCFGWTLDDVRQNSMDLLEALSTTVWPAMANRYNSRLEGEEQEIAPLDFDAYDALTVAELSQQEGRKDEARALMAMVQKVSVDLGVEILARNRFKTEPDEATVLPTEEAPSKVRKNSLFGRAFRAALRFGGVNVGSPRTTTPTPTSEIPTFSSSPTTLPSYSPWTRPAIIDKGSRDYQLLTRVVIPLLEKDPTNALSQLEKRRIHDLPDLLGRLAEVARKQGRQVVEDWAAIEADKKTDVEQIAMFQGLQALATRVADYFKLRPGQEETQ